jgi:phosphoglycolate phosphatase-like HAD superfamily hydrolase
MQIDSVLFDLDLPLADSAAGATACINHALRERGLPAVLEVPAAPTSELPESPESPPARTHTKRCDGIAGIPWLGQETVVKVLVSLSQGECMQEVLREGEVYRVMERPNKGGDLCGLLLGLWLLLRLSL